MNDELYELDYISQVKIRFNMPQMPREKRASIFAPFAALTGYEEEIAEKGRRVEDKRILDEEKLLELDYKIGLVRSKLHKREKVLVKMVYFVKDDKKDGGSYEEYEGCIRSLDNAGFIVFEGNVRIAVGDVLDFKILL